MELATVCAFLVFTTASLAEGGSVVELTPAPTSVTPYLTSHFSLQCLLRNSKSNVASVVGRRDVIDYLDFVTSLVLVKQGQGVIATVTVYTPAHANGLLNNAVVTGNLSGTHGTGSGVRGHLEVTWTDPMVDLAGSYTCEVNAITSSGHPVTFHQSVAVKVKDANIMDIMKHMHSLELTNREMQTLISDQKASFSVQQTQLAKQQMEIDQLRQLCQTNCPASPQTNVTTAPPQTTITTASPPASPHHVETGSVSCVDESLHDGGNSSRVATADVTFQQPYLRPPVIVLSLRSLVGDAPGEDVYFRLEEVNVTHAGFTVVCEADGASQVSVMEVQWLTIDQ